MAAPIKPAGIDHLVLRIRDKAATIAFYRDVIGCTVEWDRPELGLTHLRAGRALIDLVTLDGPLGARGGAGPGVEGRNLDHLCLILESFDEPAVRAHLAAHGVEVIESGERYGAYGEGPSIYVRDPEGTVVELKGAVEGAPIKGRG
jgi:catechol 2,3-dioxygenase-like lactoylglutathione lyase family enzyme